MDGPDWRRDGVKRRAFCRPRHLDHLGPQIQHDRLLSRAATDHGLLNDFYQKLFSESFGALALRHALQ